MKIVVCGSMSNYLKMKALKDELLKNNHEVILPDPSTNRQLQEIIKQDYVDTSDLKLKYDYIRKHYDHIVEADFIIIANYGKNGIENYVGGNSFLEMGFAYCLGKPIYLVNPIPQIDFYYHEMVAMKPSILNGNLDIFARDMGVDESFGGIIFRRSGKNKEVLLVKKPYFTSWDLPKGHREKGENDKEAAYRQIVEETGHKNVKLSNKNIMVEYIFNDDAKGLVVLKKVNFYIGKCLIGGFDEKQNLNNNKIKHGTEARWIKIEEALKLVSYPPFKKALQKALIIR